MHSAAAAMKAAGMLAPSTDVEALANTRLCAYGRASRDEWLQTLQVEKWRTGRIPPDQDIAWRLEIAACEDLRPRPASDRA